MGTIARYDATLKDWRELAPLAATETDPKNVSIIER